MLLYLCLWIETKCRFCILWGFFDPLTVRLSWGGVCLGRWSTLPITVNGRTQHDKCKDNTHQQLSGNNKPTLGRHQNTKTSQIQKWCTPVCIVSFKIYIFKISCCVSNLRQIQNLWTQSITFSNVHKFLVEFQVPRALEKVYIKLFKDPREDLHQMVLKLSFGFRQNCSPVNPERADQPEKKECSLHIPMLIKYDHCDPTWKNVVFITIVLSVI